jgi:hypothetical protein
MVTNCFQLPMFTLYVPRGFVILNLFSYGLLFISNLCCLFLLIFSKVLHFYRASFIKFDFFKSYYFVGFKTEKWFSLFWV